MDRLCVGSTDIHGAIAISIYTLSDDRNAGFIYICFLFMVCSAIPLRCMDHVADGYSVYAVVFC